jgi:hypothetical protein
MAKREMTDAEGLRQVRKAVAVKMGSDAGTILDAAVSACDRGMPHDQVHAILDRAKKAEERGEDSTETFERCLGELDPELLARWRAEVRAECEAEEARMRESGEWDRLMCLAENAEEAGADSDACVDVAVKGLRNVLEAHVNYRRDLARLVAVSAVPAETQEVCL